MSLNSLTTAAAAGRFARSGANVISVPSPAGPEICQNSLVTSASPLIMRRAHALLLGLADDQPGLGVIAADVDDVMFAAFMRLTSAE